MKRYLFTPGGCGTWALARFLKKMNHPPTKNTHALGNEIIDKLPSSSRILYVYSDPYNAILSFYKRGFLNPPYTHCRHMGGDHDAMISNGHYLEAWSLEQFLRNGVDFFNLADHFRSWYTWYDLVPNVLYVKYEHLEIYMPEILHFLKISKNPAKFDFKCRESNWENESEYVRNGLEKMLGRHKKFIDSLPPYFKHIR